MPHAVRDALQAAAFQVSKVNETEKLDRAEPPFKTSSLQQQAVIRLRFSGKKTMKVAQELYEGIDVDGSGPVGLITYMRTDSLRVSDEAVTAVRDKIKTDFGERTCRQNRFAMPRASWRRKRTKPSVPPSCTTRRIRSNST